MGRRPQDRRKVAKGGSKLLRLFGRGHRSSVRVKQQPDYSFSSAETYRPIGRVNPRHVQGSRRWDVRYLGCIPRVRDWQSPASRSELMRMVDEGQMQGYLMWHSLTPKMIHVNQRWMVITDDKKVMYAEFLVASVGSLAYAEDDGRHILGIKVARSPASLRGGMAEGDGIECHVLECESESVVRDVCSSANEQFLHLVAREEERQRQEEQAAAHSQAPVKTKMLRRLSKAAAGQATTTEKKESKRKRGDKKTTGKKGESLGGRKVKREKTRSTVEERADKDFVLIPLDSSGTSQGSHLKGGDGIAEEIGKQFLAVTKTPSAKASRKPGKKQRGPKPKRLSTAEGGSLSKRARNLFDQSMESLDGSTLELLPPLVASSVLAKHDGNVAKHHGNVAKHDGNVITQKLENTDGVRVPDVLDYLSSHSRTRLTLGPDSFPPSASGSEPALDPPPLESPAGTAPLRNSTSPPPKKNPSSFPSPPPRPPMTSLPSPPPPPLTPPPTAQAPPENKTKNEQVAGEVSPSSGDSMKRKSHASMLLETMEEGEVETRIDGDGEGATLLKTSMSEKETVIGGSPTPEKQPNHDRQENQTGNTRRKSLGEKESAVWSVKEEPAKPPRQRKPWPILVRVDDVVRDPIQKAYMFEVSKACGLIEFRQFRLDWLNYQRCQIDVVAFCKKSKLFFRGNKQHLREGAKLLVDREDQQTFQKVLDGKYVEPEPPAHPMEGGRRMSSVAVPPSSQLPPAGGGGGGGGRKPSISGGQGRSGGLGSEGEGSKGGGGGRGLLKGGDISNRLKMFEKPSKLTAGTPDLPTQGRSVRDLINASESGKLGNEQNETEDGGSSVRGGNVKKLAGFLTGKTTGEEGRADESERPKRGGLLSKIAAFEGGQGIIEEREDDDEEKASPPPTPGKKGRGKASAREESSQRGRHHEKREKDKRRSDSEERDRGKDSRSMRSEGRRNDPEETPARRKAKDGKKRRKDSKEEEESRGKRKEKQREREEDRPEKHRSRKKSSVDESETEHRHGRRERHRRDASLDSDEHSPSRHRRHRSRRELHKKEKERKLKDNEMNDLQGILDAGERLFKEETVVDALSQLLSEQEQLLSPTAQPTQAVARPASTGQNTLFHPQAVPQPQPTLAQTPVQAQQQYQAQEALVYHQQPQYQQPQLQGQQGLHYQPQPQAQEALLQLQYQQTQPQEQVVQLVQDAAGNVYALTAEQQPQMQVAQSQSQQQQFVMVPTTSTAAGVAQVSQPTQQVVPVSSVSQGAVPLTTASQAPPTHTVTSSQAHTITTSPVTPITAVPSQTPTNGTVVVLPDQQPSNPTTGRPELVSGIDEVDSKEPTVTYLDSEDEANGETEDQPPVTSTPVPPDDTVPPSPSTSPLSPPPASGPPPPPPTTNVGPPPPPPPPPTFGPPPPLPPPPNSDVHSQRDSLLDLIRKGKQLRKVETAPNAQTNGTEATDSPGAVTDHLLAELKAGNKLRKVSSNEVNVHARQVKSKKMNINVDMAVKDKLEKMKVQEQKLRAREEEKMRDERRREREEEGEDEGYSNDSSGGHRPRERHRSRDHERRRSKDRDRRGRRREHRDQRHRRQERDRGEERGGHHRRKSGREHDSDENDKHYDKKKHRHRRDSDESLSSLSLSPQPKRKVSSNENGVRNDVKTSSIPAWKQAILDCKQEKTTKPAERKEEEPATLPAREEKMIQKEKYQGVLPDIDPDATEVPLWKKALMKKRTNKLEEEMERERQRQEEEEEIYQSMPAWKRNIMKNRRQEQAASDAIKQQQQDEWDVKQAEIAAMPGWKRKIFLERNPQYKTD